VVDDQIRGEVGLPGEDGDVVPGPEARVDGGVVRRVEPVIRAVVRREERQEVDAAEEAA